MIRTYGSNPWRHLFSVFILISIVLNAGCKRREQSPDNSGNTVGFRQQLDGVRRGNSDQIVISSEIVRDELLSQLDASDPLRVLQLDGGAITDSGAETLGKIRALEHIRLRKSPLSDAGVSELARLPVLKILNLPHCKCTDKSMQRLAELPTLELFRFHSPHVTDEGINTLLTSDSLLFLHLIDVAVGDGIIDGLIVNKNLQSFYVDGGNITDEGFDRLFRERPDLHVHVNQFHHDLDQRPTHED